MMDDNPRSTVRYPENVKTEPNNSRLGSATGYVEFVESIAPDKSKSKQK